MNIKYLGTINMPGEEFNLPGVKEIKGSDMAAYPIWEVETRGRTTQLWLSVKSYSNGEQMFVAPIDTRFDEPDAPEEWSFWIDRDGSVISDVDYVDGAIIDVVVAKWKEIRERINSIEAAS